MYIRRVFINFQQMISIILNKRFTRDETNRMQIIKTRVVGERYNDERRVIAIKYSNDLF